MLFYGNDVSCEILVGTFRPFLQLLISRFSVYSKFYRNSFLMIFYSARGVVVYILLSYYTKMIIKPFYSAKGVSYCRIVYQGSLRVFTVPGLS